ncbi:MAG TPA: efflux RND transporter periplasmic adaptor subunit [Bacteroidota bacterium]|nr:efflux RND transporter periplasmic adaptor subunit [Bacteroidota bacterium]
MKLLTPIALALLLGSAGCSEHQTSGSAEAEPGRAAVTDNGRTISFPAGSPGLLQIGTSAVRLGKATLSVVAPARIVASIPPVAAGRDTIILFESPDVTSLYSSYRQSRANANRASANLARIRDMFDNQAATGKDLNEAENDAATSRASAAEMEGRLRAVGFSPDELSKASPGSVWVIADVPETEMNHLRRGEAATITFNSFPDEEFHGHAEALGDIVDPVTRTVKVRIAVRNEAGKLLPGMFARAAFGEEEPSAIILPLSAVVTVEGRDHVFIETSAGVFRRREVTLVNSTRTDAVVLNGIADSEQVVTRGTMLLKGLSFGY